MEASVFNVGCSYRHKLCASHHMSGDRCQLKSKWAS